MTIRNVLITGGCGFIGSNLARGCIDKGWNVDIVDDLSNGCQDFAPADCNHVYINDFSSPRILCKIEDQCYDNVFHLAALPRVSYSVEYPLKTHDVNVTKTLKLLDACKGNISRFIFASSSSVYGGATLLPTPEYESKQPKSPYALQKSIIEDYLKLYDSLYDLDSSCMRFFNVYGENQLGSSAYACAIASWLTSALSDKPLRSDGDGTQSRDLCHVSNVVDACIRAAEFSSKLHANCFNVACGDRTTNNELLSFFKDRYKNITIQNAPWRDGDVMHTQADVEKARLYLGYKPLVRIWEGLERTAKWAETSPIFLEKKLSI
jgi:nucleoside-diphosphate-sugar epimerase